jgi:hypothetical protein
MIPFHEIKIGDYVIADNDGDKKQGCVFCDQEFWYELDQLSGIPLDESQLLKLKFEKQLNADGSIKYMKGAFRILVHEKGNFSVFEIWYRDERRHITSPIFVHNLQNHYVELTKVHLNDEAFA